MKIIDKIKKAIADYLKKRYIRKELKEKFSFYSKKNKQRLDQLTESLFRASQVVKAELIETEKKKLEHENELLLNDIKTVIEKHYKDREVKLQKDNEKLERKLKEKDKKLSDIKNKVAETVK